MALDQTGKYCGRCGDPVKHGLVRRVRDYPWSSFRYQALGEYDPDWGGEDPCPDLGIPEAFW
jgi:putative transposase